MELISQKRKRRTKAAMEHAEAHRPSHAHFFYGQLIA
jgi:hypothetical protein